MKRTTIPLDIICRAAGYYLLILVNLPMLSSAQTALDGGSISTGNQKTIHGSLPPMVNASAASQGACRGVYSYQWYRSSDNQHFDSIAGATGRFFQPGPVDTTTWFKRKTICNGATAFTNTVTIQVWPRIKTDSLVPKVQSLNAGDVPSTLRLAGVSGGTGGYTYQWQFNIPGQRAWQNIPGARTASYTPTSPETTTHFRVVIHSGADSSCSPTAVVGVYPALTAGTLSPASQTVAANIMPAVLTLGSVTGGDGAYTFKWYSSPDGSTWTLLQDIVTPYFQPDANGPTSHYRAVVTSHGATLTSQSALVTSLISTSSMNQQ